MKKQIILYSGTLLIVFLAFYIRNLNSQNYPVTSTFGIEGKKVSYKLDRIHFGKDPYIVRLITDIDGITGKVVWKINETEEENILKEEERSLFAEIPALEAGNSLLYRLELNFKDQKFIIPKNDFIQLSFWGKIPAFVMWLHYIFIIGGFIFSIRTALEIYNAKRNTKKLAIFALVFFTFLALINPLKISYKIGAINKSIPSITNLFDIQIVLFVALWILGVLLIFNKSTSSIASVLIPIIALLLLFLFPFGL